MAGLIVGRDGRTASVSAEQSLSIILPAYNEEENIGRAMATATAVAERLCGDHEIIVVDDGSRDRTAEIVQEAAATDPRIRLVQHSPNRGYGEALRSGVLAAPK